MDRFEPSPAEKENYVTLKINGVDYTLLKADQPEIHQRVGYTRAEVRAAAAAYSSKWPIRPLLRHMQTEYLMHTF